MKREYAWAGLHCAEPHVYIILEHNILFHLKHGHSRYNNIDLSELMLLLLCVHVCVCVCCMDLETECTHPSIEINRMWSYHFIWSNTKWSLVFSPFLFAFVCKQSDHIEILFLDLDTHTHTHARPYCEEASLSICTKNGHSTSAQN